MAVNIGPRIGIDGEAEYRKQLNNIIQQAKTLDSEMKAVTAQFGKNADSQEALTEQSRILSQQIDVQKRRVEQLEKGLSAASKEYGETATETLKWRQAVNEAKASLSGLENRLDGLDDAVDDVGDSMEQAAQSSFGFADALKANLTAGAIIEGVKSIVGALSDIVEETKEYQRIMGSLEVSSRKAGYSAEETADSYRTLYGVLADDQTAATTTANLQALGLSQQQLEQMINGTIGAWATYGDSIPIDSLAEAINETVKTGTVTGAFADVLNWAGTSEDDFNEKLQAASTSAERANLVLGELASQGLVSAGRGWQENNAALVESNQATADYQSNMAELAERVEPITTAIRDGINRILEAALSLTENVDFSGIADSISKGFSEFVEVVVPKMLEFGGFLLQNGDTIISIVAGIGAGFAAWKVATLIQGVVSSIQAFKAANEGATIAQWAMNAAMNANPITIIVTLIAGLVTAIIALWNTNEDFRNALISAWNAVKDAFFAVWDAIAGFFTETLPNAWNSVVEWVKGIPAWWAGIWEQVGQFFFNIWNSIVSFFTETIPAWIQSVADWFWELPGKIWDALVGVVLNIVQWGLDMKKKAQEAVSSLINSIVGWFKELPGRIVQIGKDIVNGLWEGITGAIGWLGEKISGFFGGIVDGVKGILGIASPSKVFAEIGEFSGEGFEQGLSSSMGAALKDAKKEMQAGVNGLNAAVSVAGAPARAAQAARPSPSLSYGGFTINVYAAAGQDENAVADRVAAKLQSMIARKEAVFA